jgi:hypothetical protein
MKKIIFLLLILVSLLLNSPLFAANYLQGYSSVDGREIRWSGVTSYSNAFTTAISTWNLLGKINIAPDTIYTLEDLVVSDYSDSRSSV